MIETNKWLIIFFLGGLVGFFLNIYLMKRTKFWNKFKTYFKNSPIELLVIFISGIIMFGGFAITIFNIKFSNDTLFQTLSFFSSIIFSWLLANFSNERTFKLKHQDLAIKSYRHSIRAKNSLDYNIEVANLLLQKSSELELDSSYSNNVLRLRDALITAQMNSNSSIDDWSDSFSEQFSFIEKLKKLENRKHTLMKSKQSYDYSELDVVTLNKVTDQQISDIDIKIDDILQKISPNLLLVLKQEEQLKIEAIKHIKDEQRHNKAKKLNSQVQMNKLISRNDFQSKNDSYKPKEIIDEENISK